ECDRRPRECARSGACDHGSEGRRPFVIGQDPGARVAFRSPWRDNRAAASPHPESRRESSMRAIHASQASLSLGGLATLLILGAVSAHAAAVPSVSTHFLQFGSAPVVAPRVLPTQYGNTGDE